MYQFQLEFWNEFKKIFCYNTGLRLLYESSVKPWKKYDRLVDIPINEMKEIIRKENIKTIIMDMDGTLKHRKCGLTDENKEWIQSIRDDVNIYIISNANDELTSKIANEIDLPYICKARKPASYGFDKICEMTGATKDQVIVIGDAVRADIMGAERAGISKTILLKDLNIIGLEHGKDEYEVFYYHSLNVILFAILCFLIILINSFLKIDYLTIALAGVSIVLLLVMQPLVKKIYERLKKYSHFHSTIHILLWIIIIFVSCKLIKLVI